MARRKTIYTAPPEVDKEERIELDAQLIEGFVRSFLLKRYDQSKPIVSFHRLMWEDCCSSHQLVAEAAPRGHSKSTSISLAYTLAALCFGFRDYALVVSSIEGLAIELVQTIRAELVENEALIESFNIHGLSKDNEADIIGYIGNRRFRVLAKGGEQKLRGIKWGTKRPDLIIVDDIEDDEQVRSADRREKLRKWFLQALIPAGSDNCLVRVVGTVLHLDSLLNRLLKSRNWKSHCFSAHKGFDDFSEILWPEKYGEERLRAIRDAFVDEGDSGGYSQEYLNKPIAEGNEFFKLDRFQPMEEEDFDQPMDFYVGVDLAISTRDHANKSSFVVGGIDPNNMLNIIDRRTGRWDSLKIVETFFELHDLYDPIFVVEKGHIEMAIGPFFNAEMVTRGKYPRLVMKTPKTDKAARASSYRARHNAKGIKYNIKTDWWLSFYYQLSTFTETGSRSGEDDDVDAASLIGLYLNSMSASETLEEIEEAEAEYEELMNNLQQGRCSVTGY